MSKHLSITLLTFCILLIQTSCQFKCSQNARINQSVLDITVNSILGGQLYKHIYHNYYRQGTAFESWQQMLSLYHKSIQNCTCTLGTRTQCRVSQMYQGYDYINKTQTKRFFSSTLFVVDCMTYNYSNPKYIYNCFILTAYPERNSTPSWQQYNLLKEQITYWEDNFVKSVVFIIFSYFVWILILILLLYMIWRVSTKPKNINITLNNSNNQNNQNIEMSSIVSQKNQIKLKQNQLSDSSSNI